MGCSNQTSIRQLIDVVSVLYVIIIKVSNKNAKIFLDLYFISKIFFFYQDFPYRTIRYNNNNLFSGGLSDNNLKIT